MIQKNIDILQQYTDDKFSSQTSRLCLRLSLFHSAFDGVHEQSHARLHLAQINFFQKIYSISIKSLSISFSSLY